MAGLTIGTGLGCGLVINQKLYNGRNGGAGEFGMIPYLSHNIEYYASGRYFSNVHGLSGELVYEKAKSGDESALQLYHEFGIHLGKAISTILLSIDCEVIVIGGS